MILSPNDDANIDKTKTWWFFFISGTVAGNGVDRREDRREQNYGGYRKLQAVAGAVAGIYIILFLMIINVFFHLL